MALDQLGLTLGPYVIEEQVGSSGIKIVEPTKQVHHEVAISVTSCDQCREELCTVGGVRGAVTMEVGDGTCRMSGIKVGKECD